MKCTNTKSCPKSGIKIHETKTNNNIPNPQTESLGCIKDASEIAIDARINCLEINFSFFEIYESIINPSTIKNSTAAGASYPIAIELSESVGLNAKTIAIRKLNFEILVLLI